MDPLTPPDGSGLAPTCQRPDLAALLDRFGELPPDQRSEVRAHARVCGSCAPAWKLLEQAEVWLESRTSENRFPARPNPSACPAPGELYDFGSGPGARALSGERRAAVESHLNECSECRFLVRTLAQRPPLPILDAPIEENESIVPPPQPLEVAASVERPDSPEIPITPELPMTPVTPVVPKTAVAPAASILRAVPAVDTGNTEERPGPRPTATAGPRAAKPRWVLPAAAAVLLASVFGWNRWVDDSSSGQVVAAAPIRYPEQPLLRGAAGTALPFPRDRVLISERDGEVWHEPLFEILVARDDGPDLEGPFRVELSRTDGSAFDEGAPVGTYGSTEPAFRLVDEAGASPDWEAGHYTFEVWAQVRGLDTFLGRRSFELTQDPDLWERVQRALSDGNPSRALELLHENGCWTDARALARSLAPSPERDRYLETLPGR